MQSLSFLSMVIAAVAVTSDASATSKSWSQVSVPAKSDSVSFIVGLQHYVDHKEFVQRNTPGSPTYHKGKFMTREGARGLATQFMEPCRQTLKAFAQEYGMKIESVTEYDEIFELTSNVTTLEAIFQAPFITYSNGVHTVTRLQREESANFKNQLPAALQACVSHVGRVADFPISKKNVQFTVHVNGESRSLFQSDRKLTTSCPSSTICPDVLTAMYNIPDESSTTPSASIYQAVFEYGSSETQSGQAVTSKYSNSDLQAFLSAFGLPSRTFTTINGGEGSCTTSDQGCLEPNLDTQVLLTANTMNTAASQNLYYNFLDNSNVLITLADLDVSTLSVLSVSYGGPETSDTSTCDQYKSIADQGVSVFIASGDQGANFGECTSSSSSCSYSVSADANCPYVTAVGGTNGFAQGEEVGASADGNCAITSGGGFSQYFTSSSYDLSWQSTQTQNFVNNYFTATVGGLQSAANSYTTTGRGVPDISAASCNYYMVSGGEAVTVCGTSASTPAVAGMISLMAMRQSVTGWGWINPLLYQNENIFYDVTSGANYCGNSDQSACVNFDGTVYGYFASTGWDPVTGLGTLGTDGAFSALEQALVSAQA